MLRLPKIQTKTLSTRLSLMVVSAVAVLLLASLAVMFHFSRQAVKQEALKNAEQTLQGTVQHIDNVLLSIEQSAGNLFFNLIPHLDQSDMAITYCRELVKSNPYIAGCAIAFRPNYYPGHEHFMAYFHRSVGDSLASSETPIIQSETFGNRPYTEQAWYTEPMASCKPVWINPLKDVDIDIDPIITFSLPIPDSNGTPLAVIGVDVSLNLLSRIVLSAKPSPNSFCTLLASDGSFIVHPDSTKLHNQTVFTLTEGEDPTVKEAAEAMISGETGYKPFRMNGTNYYVFYKPFKRIAVPGRSIEELGWSASIIYPEDGIFGEYNLLLYYVLAIGIGGLLLLFVLCRSFAHRQLVPLRLLTSSAQRIADGNYNEVIPNTRQSDEIGELQNNFQQMQQSLAANVGELEQLTATLQERGKGLDEAYHQAQEADRVKTAFLHNMTNQMMAPATALAKDVDTLCNLGHDREQGEADRLTDDIVQQGRVITELLNNLLDLSQEKLQEEG